MRSRLAALTLASTIAAIALATGSFAPAAEPAAISGVAASGDFAGRVTLPSGRQMYLECRGSGSPTVIFEAGLRSSGSVWTGSRAGGDGTGVFPRIIPLTRACFYDRPGTV